MGILWADKTMSEKKLELDFNTFVEQMSRLIDLKLRDEYRAGVTENLERIYTQAKLVNEFELPENMEVFGKFEP